MQAYQVKLGSLGEGIRRSTDCSTRSITSARSRRAADHCEETAGSALALAGLAAFLLLWEAVPFLGLVRSDLPAAAKRAAEGFMRSFRPAPGSRHGHSGVALALFRRPLRRGRARHCGGCPRRHVAHRRRRRRPGSCGVLRPIPGLAWVPFAIIWFGVTPGAACLHHRHPACSGSPSLRRRARSAASTVISSR